MDVTAMLNASAEANGQSKLEENKGNLFRTRMPWDAGGYSLPIHTHHFGSLMEDAVTNDSLLDNHIDQRKHKLSDSHSSLSSLASPNSISHSRFSSMSTVSSLQLANQPISEASFTDSDTSPYSKTAAGSCSPVSPRTSRSISQCSSSPAFYGSSLAPIAERQFYGYPQDSVDHPYTVIERPKVRSTDLDEASKEERQSIMSSRPASPSDAILIKRTTPPIISCLPNKTKKAESEYPHTCQRASSQEKTVTVRDQQPGRLSIQTRGHKRAVSAPGFPGTVEDSLHNGCKAPASSESITDLPLLPSPPKASAPTPPPVKLAATFQDRKPCCMYISDCDTGSQLRKAVSHIFGRNKMCTRRIPPHVWVWYCRKHYQRARYRNAKEWARTLQYDLVSRQIKRLQEWSEENLRIGDGGVVQDYRLAIRKREQRRLDAQRPKGERECSDSEADEASESQGDASSSTAVPDWLLNLSGRSHDARRIMEIIDGIQADLTENNLSAWPDIEILPNIVLDKDEPGTAKNSTNRRVVPGVHGRSQSLGSTARLSEDSTGPLTGQEKISPSDGQSILGSNSQKRKRTDDREEESDIQSKQQSQRIRVSERQVRQGPIRAHRPVFQNTSESLAPEGSFGNIEMRGDCHPHASGAHTLPLAAPRPQRYTSLPTAAYIDPSVPTCEGSHSVTRRGLHKRSRSAVGGLDSCQSPFQVSIKHRRQSAAPVQYDRPAPRRLFSPPAPYASLPHREGSLQHQRAHTRHQSTPIVPLSIRCPLESLAGCRTLPRISPPSPFSSGDMIDSIRALELHSQRG